MIELPRLTFLFGCDKNSPFLEELLNTQQGFYTSHVSLYEVVEVCAVDLCVKTSDLLEFLRNQNSTQLGQVALNAYIQSTMDEGLPTIFYDCHNIRDVLPFAVKYGTDNCLIISVGTPIGSNNALLKEVGNIWIPQMELTKQLSLLEKELNPPRPTMEDPPPQLDLREPSK